MITRIHGRLSGMRGDSAIVEVNGLFYEVMLPGGLAQRLTRSLAPDESREVTFHTLHYIEGWGGAGAQRPRLIGFTEELDREFFELLTTVSGLGTRTALRALTIPIAEMAQAIEGGDTRTLGKLPRIGPRMADKIVAEAREILLQVGYRASDAATAIERVLKARPDIATSQALIQEVFRQRGSKT